MLQAIVVMFYGTEPHGGSCVLCHARVEKCKWRGDGSGCAFVAGLVTDNKHVAFCCLTRSLLFPLPRHSPFYAILHYGALQHDHYYRIYSPGSPAIQSHNPLQVFTNPSTHPVSVLTFVSTPPKNSRRIIQSQDASLAAFVPTQFFRTQTIIQTSTSRLS